MKSTCQRCGVEFDAKPAHVRAGKARSCSAACRAASRVRRIEVECRGCGAKLVRLPSLVVDPGNSFCSTGCRNRYLARKAKPDPVVDGDVVLIPLSKDQWAIVDRESFDSIPGLRDASWCAAEIKAIEKTFYAISNGILMHRLVMDAPDGYVVNHRNHDTLDNRRDNLEVCEQPENARYCRKRRSHGDHCAPLTSRFKGVTRRPSGRFIAKVKDRHLGTFDSEEEAARAASS